MAPRFKNWSATLGLLVLSAVLVSCGDTQSNRKQSPGLELIQRTTASGLATVVEFGAASCASCREMKVTLDRVAQLTQGRAHVLVLDITKDWEVGRTFNIQMMPTQVFFDAKGRESGRHIGKLTEAEIIARLGVSSSHD